MGRETAQRNSKMPEKVEENIQILEIDSNTGGCALCALHTTKIPKPEQINI